MPHINPANTGKESNRRTIRNCTVNAIKKLELSIKQLEQDLELQTISKMWLNDLLELEQNLD